MTDNTAAAVLCNGSETKSFSVETGVKQGCIIAPTLFTVFIAAILHLIGQIQVQALLHIHHGAAVCRQQCHCSPHSRRPPAYFKCLCQGLQTYWPNNKHQEVQGSPSAFTRPAPSPTITIDSEQLENVDHLGSHLSSKADIDSESQHRICCASGAFAKLRKSFFENPDLLAGPKLLVYKSFCQHFYMKQRPIPPTADI